MYTNIFDTHAHYTNQEFDADRDELLSSMPNKGVKHILLAGSSVETSVQGYTLALKYGYIYLAAGVHPEAADDTPNGFVDIIEELAAREKTAAIGEIGLDYHYDGYSKSKQTEIFEEQLALAGKLKMPVIIHSREATADTVEILRRYKPNGVVHCFSGSKETAKIMLDLGLYISFTGILTFKNAVNAVDVMNYIPIDRLLLETDCPYMAPHPFRGKRCDSSMIVYIAEKIAVSRGMNIQDVLNITCESGEKLFGI
ncbi:MAG: TatD family hydrolase [Oscillospiraceae bacterium]|jgi:TatD DNase family protein|nr:TatD family hydrolase [Oscillospiraceae bacterium]